MADPITISYTVVKLLSSAYVAVEAAATAIEGVEELSNNNTSSSDTSNNSTNNTSSSASSSNTSNNQSALDFEH